MDLSGDSEDEDDDHVPTFTPEMALLKGGKIEDDDEEMDDDEDMSGDEAGPGADPNKNKYPDAFSDSSDEKDDFTIRKTDSIIVAATAENDHSNLEVYVYEHDCANLYVHHEIILSSYPLCIEWLPELQK